MLYVWKAGYAGVRAVVRTPRTVPYVLFLYVILLVTCGGARARGCPSHV